MAYVAGNQVDLDAVSIPAAPTFDKNNGYNSVHVPVGNNRQSRAQDNPGNVDGTISNSIVIGAAQGIGLRFCNPA